VSCFITQSLRHSGGGTTVPYRLPVDSTTLYVGVMSVTLDMPGVLVQLTAPIRILVVDDFEPYRCSICSIIRQRPDLTILAEVQDGLEAVRQAEILQPDVILLDIGLPLLNGIEAARQITKVASSARIIFLTQESAAEMVHEALALGACGYVIKAHAGTELLAAVEAVAQGGTFVSAGLNGNTRASLR
jgi:DNA-binding NarL/FixJ family response regulator